MIGTLSAYMARQFALAFALTLGILVCVIAIFEFVELLRRLSKVMPDPLLTAALMSVLKVPDTLTILFHFAVLFSSMYTLWRLARHHEIVVLRAAGISAWRFLTPLLVTAGIIGLLKVAIYSPLSAVLFDQFDQLEGTFLKTERNILEIGTGGLWLRQRNETGTMTIFARRTLDGEAVNLEEVTFFVVDEGGTFQRRIDAGTARLVDGAWQLTDVEDRLVGAAEVSPAETLRIGTNLTPEAIWEGFSPPKSFSIWELPAFIDALDRTGFSSNAHRLYLQSLLAQPLLFAAMVLVAAVFSLKSARQGGGLRLIMGGVTAGFALFVLSDVITALGLSENIPVAVAAWTPTMVSSLLGIAGLLYSEDG